MASFIYYFMISFSLAGWTGLSLLIVTVQMLLDAKKQLEEVIEGKLADAASSNDHTTVLRFVRLYAPLQLKVSILCLAS